MIESYEKRDKIYLPTLIA